MVENLISMIHELISIPAPSGNEDDLAFFITKTLIRESHDISKDKLGNLVVKSCHAVEQHSRIALLAHMDEIFAVVQKIESDGFVRIKPAPGMSLRDLYGRTVLVKTFAGWIPGKVVAIPNHLTKQEYDHIIPKDLYVDVGLGSKNEIEKAGLYIGAPVVFPREFFTAHNKLFGPALDDRVGIAVLLDLIYNSDLLKHAVVIFSAKEEYLLRGSVPALRAVNPEIIICVDAHLAFDTPYLLSFGSDVRLGAGPVFSVYSFHGKGAVIGTVQSTRVVEKMAKIAANKGLPLQLSVSEGIVSEGAYGQLEGRGATVIEVGFPLRYAHTGVEVCDIIDVHVLKRLLEALVVDELVYDLVR
ncbi:MAG: hypothetical protein QXO20_04445 [Candidatus Bathyarchaeia archaeon]